MYLFSISRKVGKVSLIMLPTSTCSLMSCLDIDRSLRYQFWLENKRIPEVRWGQSDHLLHPKAESECMFHKGALVRLKSMGIKGKTFQRLVQWWLINTSPAVTARWHPGFNHSSITSLPLEGEKWECSLMTAQCSVPFTTLQQPVPTHYMFQRAFRCGLINGKWYLQNCQNDYLQTQPFTINGMIIARPPTINILEAITVDKKLSCNHSCQYRSASAS